MPTAEHQAAVQPRFPPEWAAGIPALNRPPRSTETTMTLDQMAPHACFIVYTREL
jgi:hypothetical protein